MPSLTETLITKIESSGLNLWQIAEGARVPYHPLQRWMRGQRGAAKGRTNRSYDVASADAVLEYLTKRKGGRKA